LQIGGCLETSAISHQPLPRNISKG